MQNEHPGADEEKLRLLAEALRAVDAQVKPWQARIKAGDLFRYPAADGLCIFCEVLSDRAYHGRLQNLRHCRCYAATYPQGEICGAHVSAVELLMSPDQFEDARQRGWRS